MTNRLTQIADALEAVEKARTQCPFHNRYVGRDVRGVDDPCKLCGGHAIISDAGIGAGYYVACSNSQSFRDASGCLISMRRLGGWAYNVMDWWNRLQAIEDDTPTDAGEGVEPVAWIFQYRVNFRDNDDDWSGDRVTTRKLPKNDPDFRSIRPLYTHPTPTDTGLVGELVEALEDTLPALDDIAERHGLSAPCEAEMLCGNSACDYLGCVIDKITRARTALSKAKDRAHG